MFFSFVYTTRTHTHTQSKDLSYCEAWSAFPPTESSGILSSRQNSRLCLSPRILVSRTTPQNWYCGFSSENVTAGCGLPGTQQPPPAQPPKVTPIHAEEARERADRAVVNEATQILSKLKAAEKGVLWATTLAPSETPAFPLPRCKPVRTHFRFDRAHLARAARTPAARAGSP